jgi:hypothetical protein
MAYLYFDFRDIDKQKLQDLLPSLLIQLSARSDHCCDILSQLYSAHDRGARQPNDRVMIECPKEILNQPAQGPTYIILDALDECPITSGNLSPREEVLEFVDELVGLHLPNLHIYLFYFFEILLLSTYGHPHSPVCRLPWAWRGPHKVE